MTFLLGLDWLLCLGLIVFVCTRSQLWFEYWTTEHWVVASNPGLALTLFYLYCKYNTNLIKLVVCLPFVQCSMLISLELDIAVFQ